MVLFFGQLSGYEAKIDGFLKKYQTKQSPNFLMSVRDVLQIQGVDFLFYRIFIYNT